MNKDPSFGDKVGMGLKTVGNITADIRAVVGTIVGVAMFIGGLVLLLRKPKWGASKAKITSSVCTLPTQNGSQDQQLFCNVSLSYTIADGKQYQVQNIKLDGGNWKVGDDVEIQYSLEDPTKVRVQAISIEDIKKLAWALIVLGPIIMLLSLLWAYLVHRSSLLAKISGGAAAFRFADMLV